MGDGTMTQHHKVTVTKEMTIAFNDKWCDNCDMLALGYCNRHRVQLIWPQKPNYDIFEQTGHLRCDACIEEFPTQ
jgi:hypothetical protein